jgi:D-sedoheptulose 7-phosphate isomerase
MLEQRIQQHFFDSADLLYQTAETLVRPIAEAAQALVGAITSGGKVLACGCGAAAPLAPHVASAFVGRHERERPPLAGLALPVDAAMAATPMAEQIYAQQVRALGQPGDVLLLFAASAEDAEVALAAVRAAQDREMTVVAVVGQGASVWRETLADTDVLVAVPHERRSRIVELQLLVAHCLCDAVDLQLMGEQEA